MVVEETLIQLRFNMVERGEQTLFNTIKRMLKEMLKTFTRALCSGNIMIYIRRDRIVK